MAWTNIILAVPAVTYTHQKHQNGLPEHICEVINYAVYYSFLQSMPKHDRLQEVALVCAMTPFKCMLYIKRVKLHIADIKFQHCAVGTQWCKPVFYLHSLVISNPSTYFPCISRQRKCGYTGCRSWREITALINWLTHPIDSWHGHWKMKMWLTSMLLTLHQSYQSPKWLYGVSGLTRQVSHSCLPLGESLWKDYTLTTVV